MFVVSAAQQGSGYEFDAVTRYDTRRRYKPTRHSVPSGSSITDHVSKEPIVFRLVGVLTRADVIQQSELRAIIDADADLDDR